MGKDYYVCVDIGGTAIKYALADKTGYLVDKKIISTEAKIFGAKGIVDKIKSIVYGYKKDYKLKGIAISTAGIVDSKNGIIIYAFSEVFPEYTGTKLKELLESEFGIPCSVENDVNCAALGEMWLGAGQGKSSLFCITVGTSIGGCGILDKKIIKGVSCAAGEIANMKVSGGLLHKLASTTRLVQDVASAKNLSEERLTGKQIFAWAKQGDVISQKAICSLVEHLTDGINNIVSVLNPEVIILGGGIMVQEAYLRPLIESALKERLFDTVYNDTQISFAKLGNDAGLLGALYNFLNNSYN